MLPTLSGALSHLHLLPSLLRATDPSLAHLLPPNPFYALSATLTLFAHVVPAYASISRLFDYLLAAPAAAPIYLFAAVIRSRREELLQLDPHDQDTLHFALSKVPQPLAFDSLVADADTLMRKYPPSTLGSSWRSLSRASTLRTAPDAVTVATQTLEQGEIWLKQQAAEAKRKAALQKTLSEARRTIWKVRKPVAFVGSAIAVALVAAWIMRGNADRGTINSAAKNVVFGAWKALGGL
jgi:TBC1 domain family member 20